MESLHSFQHRTVEPDLNYSLAKMLGIDCDETAIAVNQSISLGGDLREGPSLLAVRNGSKTTESDEFENGRASNLNDYSDSSEPAETEPSTPYFEHV